MKISVIVPTYKPQSYLWECLDSLRNQTFPKEDFEILLILNGCKDPYQSQIENYIFKNEIQNLRLIQTNQPGVSNARNIGLDSAIGDYIAFIDDDDYVSPYYLEGLYKKVYPETISLCYPYAFNDDYPDIQLPYSKTDIFEFYSNKKVNIKILSKVRKYFSGPCMKLIPMSIIQDRRFDVRLKNGEDSLFMFLISDRIKNITFSSDNAIYYRRFRINSAFTSKRSLYDVVKNFLYLNLSYFKIYIRGFYKYNFLFFITRILALIKGLVKLINFTTLYFLHDTHKKNY